MEKNLKFLLLVLAGSLFLFLGCKKDHVNKTTPTTFTLNTTAVLSEGEETGYFFASGDPTTSGTYRMIIQVDGDSLHCSQTLTDPKGTIVIQSDCSLASNEGKWFVTDGTDAYWNLEGKGTLIMEFPTNAPGVEALRGVTWRN